MDMNTTTYLHGAVGQLGAAEPNLTEATYNKTLLERAQPELVFQRFGMRKPLSQRQGMTMVFRRYEKLAKALIPITQGVTPDPVLITRTNVNATIEPYGNWTIVPDMSELTEYDPLINEISGVMGENMGETVDTVIMGPLVAGTQFCRVTVDGATLASQAIGAGARSTVDGAITKLALDYAIRILDGNNAKTFTPMIGATDKVSTQPVAKSYWAVLHSYQVNDLYDNGLSGLTAGTDFIPVERYASTGDIVPGEVGKYRSIRFVATTESKVWADSGADPANTIPLESTSGSACDVYATLVFGRDAYGIVPLTGGSARAIIHRAGGPGDPLNQRHTVGWKYAGCSCILNDEWLFRIESGTRAIL